MQLEDWSIILLAAVIAGAAVTQVIVAVRLLRLQHEVEAAQSRIEVYSRFKCARSGTDVSGWADLQIANLSGIGIWVETVKLVVEPGVGEVSEPYVVAIERIIPAHRLLVRRIDDDIRQAVMRMPGHTGTLVTQVVISEAFVHFRAKGRNHVTRTGRYTVTLGPVGVDSVAVVRGKSRSLPQVHSRTLASRVRRWLSGSK